MVQRREIDRASLVKDRILSAVLFVDFQQMIAILVRLTFLHKANPYWNISKITLPSEFFGAGIFKICAIVGAISVMFIGFSLT